MVQTEIMAFCQPIRRLPIVQGYSLSGVAREKFRQRNTMVATVGWKESFVVVAVVVVVVLMTSYMKKLLKSTHMNILEHLIA